MRCIEKKLQLKELQSQDQVLAHGAGALVAFLRVQGLGDGGRPVSAGMLWPRVAECSGPAARGQPRGLSPALCGRKPCRQLRSPHSRISVSRAGFILNQLDGGHSSQHPEQAWGHPEAEGAAHVWGPVLSREGAFPWSNPHPQDHASHLIGQNRSHAQLRPSNPW